MADKENGLISEVEEGDTDCDSQHHPVMNHPSNANTYNIVHLTIRSENPVMQKKPHTSQCPSTWVTQAVEVPRASPLKHIQGSQLHQQPSVRWSVDSVMLRDANISFQKQENSRWMSPSSKFCLRWRGPTNGLVMLKKDYSSLKKRLSLHL